MTDTVKHTAAQKVKYLILGAHARFNDGDVADLQSLTGQEIDAAYDQLVAACLPDGSWVGWTYWYGGGKHAEPEAIDWIDDAYNLACSEEEKLVIVRAFAKLEGGSA